MTFVNITNRGIYLQACHREVAPGSSFEVPWLTVKEDRGVRAAMAARTLAWISATDEPEIPGSPEVPKPEDERAQRKRQAEQEAQAAKELLERQAQDEAAMKENMARMGQFNVPQFSANRSPVTAAKAEKPVTKADVIADDKPKSLADIRRHNKAVRTLGPDGS